MAPASSRRSGTSGVPKDPDLVDLGARLRSLRDAAGLTQEELARQAAVHWTYVGQIERGERNCTYKNLLRLAHGLGIAPAQLLPSEPRVPFVPGLVLTDQQHRIVALLRAGASPAAAADTLGLSLAAVRRDLSGARRAIGAGSLRELLLLLPSTDHTR